MMINTEDYISSLVATTLTTYVGQSTNLFSQGFNLFQNSTISEITEAYKTLITTFNYRST